MKHITYFDQAPLPCDVLSSTYVLLTGVSDSTLGVSALYYAHFLFPKGSRVIMQEQLANEVMNIQQPSW